MSLHVKVTGQVQGHFAEGSRSLSKVITGIENPHPVALFSGCLVHVFFMYVDGEFGKT